MDEVMEYISNNFVDKENWVEAKRNLWNDHLFANMSYNDFLEYNKQCIKDISKEDKEYFDYIAATVKYIKNGKVNIPNGSLFNKLCYEPLVMFFDEDKKIQLIEKERYTYNFYR